MREAVLTQEGRCEMSVIPLPEPHHIGRSDWDGSFEDGYPLAEAVCKQRLVVTDGSVEAGMVRLGEERFDRWVLQVEAALEKVNPK